MKSCSVCIPTYRRPAQLNRLLASLLAMDDRRIAEVIVAVTDGREESTDADTGHILRMCEIRGLPCSLVDGVDGLSSAKALFKEAASCDIVLILDDDMLVTADYLDLLDDFEDGNVGAVGGSMHTPLDIGHYSDWSYDPVDNPRSEMVNLLRFTGDGIIEVEDKYQVYMTKEPAKYRCQCLASGALFFRRDLLEVDPFFDRGASVYEDFDITYSLYHRGYDLVYDSSRIAYHLRADSGGCRDKSAEKQEQRRRNAAYMREKYGL